MGTQASRIGSTKWDLDQLAKASGLSRSEIEQLYSDYVKASGRDGVMDMKEFIQLYSKLPIARSQHTNNVKDQARRVFRAFDQDHNGILSFDEFLNAIVMMNCQKFEDARLEYLTEKHNNSIQVQDDKDISMEYGLQIFRRLNDFHGLPAGTEHRCWKEVDRYNHGHVTHEDLVDYISRQPIYNRK